MEYFFRRILENLHAFHGYIECWIRFLTRYLLSLDRYLLVTFAEEKSSFHEPPQKTESFQLYSEEVALCRLSLS